MIKPFRSSVGLRPRRTPWNLSYSKKFTTDMGKLIPIMCDEAVPGDVWKIGNECVIRFQPLLAPILHEVNVYVHYFFVPYRLLWSQWEDFITGGDDGTFTASLPNLETILSDSGAQWSDIYGLGKLADYLLNLPPDHTSTGWSSDGVDHIGTGDVSAFPFYAYNLIWNEYYRDETVDSEVNLWNYNVLRRRWKKDYFTSSLPFRQRGIAPALPVSTTFALPSDADLRIAVNDSEFPNPPSSGVPVYAVQLPSSGNNLLGIGTSANSQTGVSVEKGALQNALNAGVSTTTFDINDMRLAFQMQKWLERNARCGARYTEQLRAHFGVAPNDSRLQRPEYIGGTKSGVIFSEVLQTSASQSGQTKQGNMAGHGLVASSGFAGRYRVQEFGLIMGIMSVVPKSTYSYGINRQWLRSTKYDFFFPEFSHLGEQAIQNRELWANFSAPGTPEDDIDGTTARGIFGYQGRYDEMRYKPSTVHSGMRKTFDYWHLSREFSSQPHLNSSFLECNPSKRIFAVQNEDGLIVNFFNKIRCSRPIPLFAEPGLVDHF